MKPQTRLIFLHPSLHKHSPFLHLRLLFFLFLSLTTLAFLLLHRRPAAAPTAALPADVAAALLHYAAAHNASDRFSAAELAAVAAALRRPRNLLVFGLTAETLLWHTLNRGGRTVFLDENEHRIAKFESSVAGFEGYDVQYTTTVGKFRELMKSRRKTDCRPVQNLLFSDCSLGINDLPNHIYSIPWDVIIVDGPSGYSPESPGRSSAIFTAAVLARSRRAGGVTDVFVHDYGREVERVSSKEFLCEENLVEVRGSLAHFAVPEMEDGSSEFCRGGGGLKGLSVALS